jgi:hypothetical protein
VDIRLYAPASPEETSRLVRIDDDRVEVIRDKPARLVAGRGRPRTLVEVDVGSRRVDTLKHETAARLVYGDRFDADDLRALQDRQWCGIDHAGQLVVTSPDLTVVVIRPRAQPSGLHGGVTASNLRGVDAADDTAGIRGATTARLAQLLLEAPGATWGPTKLAAADGLAAPATASRLLAELAHLGLVTSINKSRTHDYRLVQTKLFADWLAEQTRPPHPGMTLSCYARFRDAAALLDHLSTKVRSVPYSAVLTGSAAALIEGVPLTTSLTTALVRVDPDRPLSTVWEDFEVTPVSNGANVRLIKDVGRVATRHPRTVNGIPLAGIVRTWLDVRSEPRGADAADLYWDQIVEPNIGTST